MGKTPDDQRQPCKRHQGIADLVTSLAGRRDQPRTQLALGGERVDAEEQHQAQDHHRQSQGVSSVSGPVFISFAYHFKGLTCNAPNCAQGMPCTVIPGRRRTFRSSYAGLTRVSIQLQESLAETMDCRVKPGNDGPVAAGHALTAPPTACPV